MQYAKVYVFMASICFFDESAFEFRGAVFVRYQFFPEVCVFRCVWRNPTAKMCVSTLGSFWVVGQRTKTSLQITSQMLVFEGF